MLCNLDATYKQLHNLHSLTSNSEEGSAFHRLTAPCWQEKRNIWLSTKLSLEHDREAAMKVNHVFCVGGVTSRAYVSS